VPSTACLIILKLWKEEVEVAGSQSASQNVTESSPRVLEAEWGDSSSVYKMDSSVLTAGE
jgi:hypothetical protein